MKKTAILLTLAFSSVFALSACGVRGSGVRKTEKRDLPAFTAIETTGAFEVEVTCQKTASFEIEADDNLLPLIETEVKGGVLRVTTTKHYSSSRGIALRIALPNLESVRSTGAGKIDAHNLRANKANVRVTGAAVVEVNAIDELDVTVSGAGRVTYSGSPKVTKHVSGAGQVTKKETSGA